LSRIYWVGYIDLGEEIKECIVLKVHWSCENVRMWRKYDGKSCIFILSALTIGYTLSLILANFVKKKKKKFYLPFWHLIFLTTRLWNFQKFEKKKKKQKYLKKKKKGKNLKKKKGKTEIW